MRLLGRPPSSSPVAKHGAPNHEQNDHPQPDDDKKHGLTPPFRIENIAPTVTNVMTVSHR
jgi:hypothetical protein